MAIKIVKGSDKSFILQYKSAATKDPYDFTNLVTAEVKILKQDGTTMTKNLTGGVSIYGHPKLGKLKVDLNAETDTASLKEGIGQDIESKIEIGTASAGDASNFVDWQILKAKLDVYQRKTT